MEMAVGGRLTEWSQPALVLSCLIGTVLDEEPCDIEMTVG